MKNHGKNRIIKILGAKRAMSFTELSIWHIKAINLFSEIKQHINCNHGIEEKIEEILK